MIRVLLLTVLLATPAYAQPKTPRAEPPQRRVKDELSCKSDADCFFLPSVCRACPPCKPTWRPVGNRDALRRIKKMAAVVSCPAVKCRRCASRANWLGKRPSCARGRCWVQGKPLPARAAPPPDDDSVCYKTCLARSQMQAMSWEAIQAQCRHRCKGKLGPPGPPARPRSKERACKRDGECALRPRGPCTCAPCGATWRRAISRRALRLLKLRWAKMRCRRPVCPACVGKLLGTRAACVEGQCTIRP